MAKTAAGVSGKPEVSTKEAKTVTTKKVTKTTTRKKSKSSNRRRGSTDADNASDTRSSKQTDSSKSISACGEEAAARFLDRHGYTILERNWACFAGEVDIVATDGDTLVFVEVKTRKDTARGFAHESNVVAKRERFEKISLAYLLEHDYNDMSVRFDVVSVIILGPDRAYLRHHLGAYSSSCN